MTAPPPDASPSDALRRPGRPRDVRAAGAILEASVAVLADKGPSGFTVDEVAARAGCGKATIYRRWPSRADLLVETAHHMGLEPPASDTGSLREDLVSVLVALGTKMRDTPTGRILPGIIAEASVDVRMKEVLARFIHDRRQRPREMVERGIRRGELPADTDVDLLLDLMGGTVIYRELIACQPTDEPTVRALVDVALAGFGASPAEPAAERP